MFRKLRNKFIFTNLLITTAILFVAYGSIYFIASRSSAERKPIPDSAPIYADDVQNIVVERINEDRNISQKNLLTTLISTGIAVEIIVAFVSYLLAEKSIEPVKKAYDSQKTFIANASHEIKTPLAAIRANLEAANIEKNHWIKNVETEVELLTSLNNQLLTLAKTDALPEEIKLEKTNLKSLIDENLEPLEPRLKSKKLEKHLPKSSFFSLNKSDFSLLFNILIDNAIKYSNKKIIIIFSEKTLIIKNDGAIIPTEKLPHIFDRFYQTDKSNSGVGLGLAIAKSLAERNGWQLSASNDKNFTIFMLTLNKK